MTHKDSIMPDIKFGLFYNEILPAMLEYKRLNMPELSDENPLEPGNQFIRMMAAALHYSNALIDTVGSELLLSTSQKTDVVREQLRDIGYEMSPGKSAKSEVILEFSQIFGTVPKTISTKYSRFLANTDDGAISYLAENDLILTATNDNVSNVFINEVLNVTPWQDVTSDAKSQITPADDVQPFTSLNQAGDAIYFGHLDVMFDAFKLYFTTENLNIQGFWEFYDGNFQKSKPDSVEIKSQTIKFTLNKYLGSKNKQNTKIKVKCLKNDYEITLYSFWDGVNNIVESPTYMLQSDPSTDISDYIVGSDWEELDFNSLTIFGKDEQEVSYLLPQSETKNWIKTELYDGSPICYWIRFRLTEKVQGTLPVMQYIEFISTAKTYMTLPVKQGRRQTDVLGSSNNSPLQLFKATKEYFIDDSDFELTVDAVVWTRVYDFVSSVSNDKHYVIELDTNDVPIVNFGNGINGAIPNKGVSNIIFTYNYDVKLNGNVGAKAINSSAGGITYISRVYNPRGAVGWTQAEGLTKESIRLAKINASKEQRIIEVALNSDDVEYMATKFSGDGNESLFSRAFCLSDADSAAYGPKTLKLVVTMKGGTFASQEQLNDFALYFNGNKFSNPPVKSKIVSNQKLFAVNYTPKIIDIKVTVFGTKITSEGVKAVINELLDPEAKDKKTGNYIWGLAESISKSKLSHLIHEISPNITKVEFDLPTQDITMNTYELPKAGIISVKIG
jgi:hypothetical protein